ncbi:MAG: MerR family transcriptional regulator [Sulfurimonas sp.]|jgi:DNA-binding transcriptional MerR regulator
MKYKISQIVELTQTPKSTILYYIREGLLPEAKKLKSNVHRYSDEHVELLEYIKYMKQEMGSSNEEIKSMLKNKNSSLSSSFSMIAPMMQTLENIPKDAKHFTKEEFIKEYEVDAQLLEELLKDEILLPLGSDDFTQKEASIVKLVKNFQGIGVEYSILREYASHAKTLSTLEYEMQKKLCAIRDDENFSTLWKIMFETLFVAKEYMQGRSTHKVLYEALKEEISKK